MFQRFAVVGLLLIQTLIISCETGVDDDIRQCSTPQAKDFVLSPSVASVISGALLSRDATEISDLISACGEDLTGYDKATAYEARGIIYAMQERNFEARENFRNALALNALPDQRQDKLKEYIQNISKFKDDCFGLSHCGSPNRIVQRVAPEFPIECLDDMSAREFIQLSYDVNPSGIPENIRPLDVTNECFLGASVSALKQWRYAPLYENGERRWRRGLETSFSFVKDKL